MNFNDLISFDIKNKLYLHLNEVEPVCQQNNKRLKGGKEQRRKLERFYPYHFEVFNFMYYKLKNYEDNYLISKNGVVKSIKTGKIRKSVQDKKGYMRIGLCKAGRLFTHKVHRLVAEQFLENKLNKPQVNHKNGIKNDNKVTNLEWVTNKENMHHAYNSGLKVVTDNQRESARKTLTGNTYSNKKIINVNTNVIYDSVKDASKSIGLSRSALSGMLTGFRKNWTPFKYHKA